MKVNGHGQAKILNDDELDSLFTHGLLTDRDKALFGVCLFTAARINEACTLIKGDCLRGKGFHSHVILRKRNTKGQTKTREIPFHPMLMFLLDNYLKETTFLSPNFCLFPGRGGIGNLSPKTAHHILTQACKRVNLMGVSTHSFRRTCLTRMHSAGIPLRHIQEISGHESLSALQKYLEVEETDKIEAIKTLDFFKRR